MLGNVNIKSRQAYFHTRFLVVLLPCIIRLYFCNVANALEIELYDKFRCFAAIGILVTGKALRYSYTVQKLLVCGTLALNLSSSSLIVSSYFLSGFIDNTYEILNATYITTAVLCCAKYIKILVFIEEQVFR